jgi:hypothetical protein
MASQTIRFMGDVHGHFGPYEKIIKECRNSIQVGDMGLGFRHWPDGEEALNPPYDVMVAGRHQSIRGNHDNPAVCCRHTQCIPDGTIRDGIMFIGGGFSIDKPCLIEDFSWWPGEELSIAELKKLVALYARQKPRIMVTHDCPREVGDMLLSRIPHAALCKKRSNLEPATPSRKFGRCTLPTYGYSVTGISASIKSYTAAVAKERASSVLPDWNIEILISSVQRP